MPWRHPPGEAADPYRVWLSEIMLQQTTVAAVIPYFERFLSRFPTVAALAEAPEEVVMAAWAGLGYYARARNLHACAKQVAALGGFPATVEALRLLPGIGAYTSAAIAAIAFGVPVVPIDGNVERVISRLAAITTPLPASRPAIAVATAAFGSDQAAHARPSDFAQALFDLGATICTSTNPACALCPLMAGCQARAQGIAAELPRKLAKKKRPIRHGAHFWLTNPDGQVLLRRRPPRGLLGGMTELPGTTWRSEPWTEAEAIVEAPMRADWRLVGRATHGFTHFELLIDVYAATSRTIQAEGFLRPAADLGQEAFPTVMLKCVRVAQDAALSPAGGSAMVPAETR
ncbi:A/G-specific adenine glycosylase [Acidisphaera sp. L21]|uniref:A/G-specific adenine glycosylase n=1 Tax=Acidisphaera sp. L21 TaxID=1641851 RepID=UPI0020B16A56|nr:A/G-specific adenine glycosylase [Acidisphaera sp. L21]